MSENSLFDIRPLPEVFKDPDARQQDGNPVPVRCRRRRVNAPAMVWPPPLDPARTRAERDAARRMQPTRYESNALPAQPGPSLPAARENVTEFNATTQTWNQFEVQKQAAEPPKETRA